MRTSPDNQRSILSDHPMDAVENMRLAGNSYLSPKVSPRRETQADYKRKLELMGKRPGSARRNAEELDKYMGEKIPEVLNPSNRISLDVQSTDDPFEINLNLDEIREKI